MESMNIRIVWRVRSADERRGVIPQAWLAVARDADGPDAMGEVGYGHDPQEAARDAVYRLVQKSLMAR